MTETPFPSLPGYRILKVLGEGGMATVYLAVQALLERQVALKVLKTTDDQDPSFGRRFLREARIASQLAHPNIVTVYDVGVHEGMYFLSMEYIAGPDLKRARTRLSFAQKWSALLDVAMALEFAASKGYVHRDIKPENIVLREPGLRAVLMDFGIARGAQPDLDMTQAGTSLGTPNYMSPEQIRGDPIDYRSDLYSLGVVLYFLLVGRLPYIGDSAVSVGIKHLTEPVPLLPKPYAALQGILNRLMAKQPEQRYQAVRELIDDMRAADVSALEARTASYDTMVVSADTTSVEQPSGGADQAETVIGFQWAAALRQLSPAKRRDKPFVARWIFPAIVLPAAAVALGLGWHYWHKGAELPIVAQDSSAVEREATASSSVMPELPDLSALTTNPPGTPDRLSWADRLLGKTRDALQSQIAELQRRVDRQGWSTADRQRSDALAREAFTEVRHQLNAGQFGAARKQFEQYQSLFSEHWRAHQTEYESLSDLIALSGQLQTLYEQAEQALKENRLVAPEEDNALNYYLQMLALHDGYPLALHGLKDVVTRLKAHAEESYQQGAWGRAYTYAQYILQMQPEDRRAREMAQIIEDYQREENQVLELLGQARALQEAGHYFAPDDQNAYALYQRVLTLRPDNESATEGLQSVREAFQRRVDDMLANDDLEFAQYEIHLARQNAPDEAYLRDLSDKLNGFGPDNESNGDASANTVGPRIAHAWIGDAPRDDWQSESPGEVRSGRTLHGAIQYQGFTRDARQIVSAVLEDRSGLRVESVPIVLSRPFGETRFRLDRAVEPFAPGHYTLRFLLEERELLRLEFRVVD